jgi:hypothetical protein
VRGTGGIELHVPINYGGYNWYQLGIPGSLGSTHTLEIPPPSSDTIVYCCDITDTATGCSTTRCVTVVEEDPECTLLIAVDHIHCNTYSYFVYPSVSNPIWTVTPSSGVTILPPNPGNSASITFSEAGYYSIQVQSDTSCGEVKESIPYVPKFKIEHNPCTNKLTITDQTLDYDFTPTDHTYTVSSPEIPLTIINVPTFTTSQIQLSPDITIAQTLTVTLNYGPEDSCTMTKTIDILPKPEITNIEAPAVICSGTPFEVSVLGNGTIDLYTWDFGDNSSARGDMAWHTYHYSPVHSNTYSITVYGFNTVYGCYATASHQITVNPNPLDAIQIVARDWLDGDNCLGQRDPLPTIELSNYSSSYNYYWVPAPP